MTWQVSGSKDGELRLWDLARSGTSEALLAQSRLPPGSGVTGIASALPGETRAQLYASTTSGHVHALATATDASGVPALRLVATGGEGA